MAMLVTTALKTALLLKCGQTTSDSQTMWLLALEAFGAFFIFVFIIWWTMFSGRPSQQKKQTQKDKDETSS